MGAEAGEPSSFLSLSAAFSYGIASMAMVFVNKAIIMQYAHSMTLLTLQQIATALIIHFGQILGVSKRKDFNIAIGKKLLPLSIFYNANVAFALASLKGVNIPMYIAIKRLTPLAVLVAGCLRGKGKPPTQVSLSVICTAAGVLIAALGDFSFDLYGYSMALTSVFFQTMYLILVEKSGAEDGLSSVELMFYNSVLSLPFLFFIIIATGEFPYSLSVLSEKVSNANTSNLIRTSKIAIYFAVPLSDFQSYRIGVTCNADGLSNIQCYSSHFAGDGYRPEFHHVLVHGRELRPYNNNSRSSQGCWIYYPGFRSAGRCGSTYSQRYWIGDQYIWRCLVFICEVYAEEEDAKADCT